jgi:hypothetical protein
MATTAVVTVTTTAAKALSVTMRLVASGRDVVLPTTIPAGLALVDVFVSVKCAVAEQRMAWSTAQLRLKPPQTSAGQGGRVLSGLRNQRFISRLLTTAYT